MLELMGEKLYSMDEVSELLGVSRESIRKYSKRSGVTGRRVNRVKYYTEGEIKKLLSLPEPEK